MDFTETILKGAFVFEGKRFDDDRGFFVQEWSARELAAACLDAGMVECNRSSNRRIGHIKGNAPIRRYARAGEGGPLRPCGPV